jgi:aminoglycoside/choline kinase family phosphotransferase
MTDLLSPQTSPREQAKEAFIRRAGWADAQRCRLAGDASDRSYDRLIRRPAPGPQETVSQSAVLMDAPPGRGDDPADFLRIGSHLLSLGLSAPRALAQDPDQGFLLLEDFGDRLVARLVAEDPASEIGLYSVATDVLAEVQAHAAPAALPDLSAGDWAEAAGFAPRFYGLAATGAEVRSADFHDELGALLTAHADGPRVLILRDYHAENLIWLPQRAGLARMGLLDFQLGQMGQPGYDLVSLLQDARRDVSPATEAVMIARFITATGAEAAAFHRAYAVLGAQRALRIIGIFARLCLIGGKAQYLPLIPRVWAQLQRNLAAPGLERLSAICASILPAPSPAILSEIEKKCATLSR